MHDNPLCLTADRVTKRAKLRKIRTKKRNECATPEDVCQWLHKIGVSDCEGSSWWGQILIAVRNQQPSSAERLIETLPYRCPSLPVYSCGVSCEASCEHSFRIYFCTPTPDSPKPRPTGPQKHYQKTKNKTSCWHTQNLVDVDNIRQQSNNMSYQKICMQENVSLMFRTLISQESIFW